MLKELIAEQPLMISLMLGTMAAGLIFGWLQTGKKAALVLGLIFAIFVPMAWVAASKLETDREVVERLIYEAAAAVQNNDHDGAVKVIGDPQTQARARGELSNWNFSLAAVNKLRSIKIIQGTSPLEADVDMTVKVDVSSARGGVRNARVARRLLLKFQKTDTGWVVTDYQNLPMIGGPDNFTNTLTRIPSK